MIAFDQKLAVILVGAVLTSFGSSAVLARGHIETPLPVTAITAEDMENTGTTDLSELLKNVPELRTTARRTEESVLDVGLSIRTLNSGEIQAAQISDLSDVANVTPGFSFQNYFGQNLSVPTMRGVGQVDIFGDPNAPIYIDGIYVSSKTGINFGFLDIERIEVLRGPQPAFFGYNAFSGAVNFVTARPADEFSIDGEVTFGTDESRRVATTVSGPMVGDVLSGRLGLMYDNFGGTYSNASPYVDQDIGGYKYKTASGSLFFTPGDAFSAQLNVYVSDDHIDPAAMSSLEANCEPELADPDDPLSANPGRLLNYCGDLPTVGKNDLATIPGETGQTREVFRASLNLDWELDYGTFSSLTGISETKDEAWASADRGEMGTVFTYQTNVAGAGPTPPGLAVDIGLGDPQPNLIPFFPPPVMYPAPSVLGNFVAPLLQSSAGKDVLEDFSQEFRFTSPQDAAFRYTAGLYLRNTEERFPIPEEDLYAPMSSLPANFDAFCPCWGPDQGYAAGEGAAYFSRVGVPFPPGYLDLPIPDFIFGGWFASAQPGLDYVDEEDTELRAVFFNIEYDIIDNLTYTVEGRYTDYEETEINDGEVSEFSDNFFNWRMGLEYQPDDLSLIYASVATGVKQGGLDSIEADAPGTPIDGDIFVFEYGKEKITTFEAGYKTIMNDGDTVFDTSVFLSDWKDIVLPQIVESINGTDIQPEGVSANIGEGRIAGIELDLRNKFTDSLDGRIGVSYNRARFNKGQIESFTGFPSFAPNGSMAGQTLSRQPEFQANANLTFRTQFNSDWEWYTRGDVNYQSRWYVGLPNQARIPGRFRANARIGLDSEKYTVELWVNNLFDDDTVESAFRDVYLSNAIPGDLDNYATVFPWRLTVSHPTLRTFGVTLRGRF